MKRHDLLNKLSSILKVELSSSTLIIVIVKEKITKFLVFNTNLLCNCLRHNKHSIAKKARRLSKRILF